MTFFRSLSAALRFLCLCCLTLLGLCLPQLGAETYTVTFDLAEHGTLLSGELQQAISEGGTATAPVVSVAEDWAFVDWDGPYHDVSSDLIVIAQYLPESLAGILEDKVLASDGSSSDDFGRSVSVSGDTAVIGAPYDKDNGYNSGSAYVYVRSRGVWTEQAKLTASDGVAYDAFGYSVSLSGGTMIVSARNDDDNGIDSGSVYVFVRRGNLWTEQAKLTGSDGATNDHFGVFVSVSGDTVLIGATGNDDNGYRSGSAYVFLRSEGVWIEQAKLTVSDGAEYDHFGGSVSLSGDTALIGATGNDDNGSATGSAYVFVRSEGVWIEQTKLTASDGAEYDHFGGSVSLSGDTALIGATGNDDNGSNSGSAYVFVRSEGVWMEQTKLIASDGAGSDDFGESVSLSGDMAVVGAYHDKDNGRYSGSAYVYIRNGEVWTEKAKLSASDGAYGGYFGSSVSLSGATALIGAFGDDDNGWDGEYAYFYDLGVDPFTVTFELDGKVSRIGGGELSQQVVVGGHAIAPILEVDPGLGLSSWSADFSEVTEDLIITAEYLPEHTVTFDLGAYGNSARGELVQVVLEGQTAMTPELSVEDGWAFVGWDRAYHDVTESIVIRAQYLPSDLAGVAEEKLLPSDGSAYSRFGNSVSVHGDTAVIGVQYDGNDGNDDAGSSVYVFVRNENLWTEQAKLLAGDYSAYDHFGISVSVSGDTVLVGSAEDDENGVDSGSAYVFVRRGEVWREQAKLLASDGAFGDYFGYSVSLNGDTAVIGAYGDDDDDSDLGSAYVFVRHEGQWEQQAKLLAGDGKRYDRFGSSVSVNGDTAVVGAYLNDGIGSNTGSAYVFVRNGDLWAEQVKLTASDAAQSDGFGSSVSVSGDTAVIGAYHGGSGSAYVFERRSGVWTEEAKLTASDGPPNDYFGESVSISGDVIMVGALSDDGSGYQSGSVHRYVRRSGMWTAQAKLLASDGSSYDRFGSSVAVSGATAVVGAPGDDDNGRSSGSAYFYDFGARPVTVTFDTGASGSRTSGGALSQQVRLGDSAEAPILDVQEGWYFIGWDIDVSSVVSDLVAVAVYVPAHEVIFDIGERGTLLSGELQQFIVASGTAIAPELSTAEGWDFIGWDREYSDISDTTTVTAQYIPSDLAGVLAGKLSVSVGLDGDRIGRAVSVSGDTVVVGASGDDRIGLVDAGAVYVYQRQGGDWVEQATLTASDSAPYDYFGTAVCLSGDTVIVGSSYDDDNGDRSGSAYIFIRQGDTWTEQVKLTASDGESGDYFGAAVSLDGETAVVASDGDDGQGENSGSAYVYVRSGGAWIEQAKLTADDGAEGHYFGASVGLSGESLIVGTPSDDENGTRSGSAYVFIRSEGEWLQQAKVQPDDGVDFDYFGYSVSISGGTILVGATGSDAAGSSSGSAYVFVRNEGAWNPQGKLTASDASAYDVFGHSVSISGDMAVVGAYQDDGSEVETGSVYVYRLDGDVWVERHHLIAEDGIENGRYGTSVSLSGDVLVVGAVPYTPSSGGGGGGDGGIVIVGPSANATSLYDTLSTGKVVGASVEDVIEYDASSESVLSGDDYSASQLDSLIIINPNPIDPVREFSYIYDLGVPPATVTFDLGVHGSRVGGGELSQLLKVNTAAIAPEVRANPGWMLDTWDTDFSAVTFDLVVTALYSDSTTIGSAGYLTYLIFNHEVAITYCDEQAAGALVIPATIEGLPVTSISYNAFAECSRLTSVTIPGSVTRLGSRAFTNCNSLISILFEGSTAPTLDGSDVFDNVSAQASIIYPAGGVGYSNPFGGLPASVAVSGPPVWEPQGWIYYTWPYAYSFTEGHWHFFEPSNTQWRINLSNGQWGTLPEATGWHYYAWPYSYSIDADAWHWYNADTQWVVDLASGVWSLFGHREFE